MASIIGVSVSVILGIVIYNTSVAPVKDNVTKEIIGDMEGFIDSQINLKIQAGIIGSSALSIQNYIAEALAVEERDEVLPALSSIRDQFKNQTNYKNIQTHLMTADGRSMVKTWDLDSYGQDMSNSPIIQQAMKEQKAVGSLSIGGRGVSIIAISPVIQDGEFMGMISMTQGLASVRKTFTKKTGGQWILLVDKEYVKNKFGNMPVLDNNIPFTDRYILANNRWFPEDSVNFAKQAYQAIDGENNAVYLSNGKSLIDIPAYDEEQKVFGRHLFILDEQAIQHPIDKAMFNAEVSMIGNILAIFILSIVFVIGVNRMVITPLQRVQKSTTEILTSGDFSIRNSVQANDEVGKTAESINQLLEQISQALNEATHTVHAISDGDFTKRITGNYSGELNALKTGINDSMENISSVMDELSKVMTAMRDANYDIQISNTASGRYRSMLEDASQAMNETNLVISEINNVMQAMQQGEFSSRVTIDAHGSLATLKERINESMTSLYNAIEDISNVVTAQSEGNLTKTIDNAYEGDLLQLKNAVNQSIEKLSTTVSQVMQSAQIVNQEASSVSSGSNELSARMQQQASAIEETSATMEEMNSAVQNNTESARHASEVVEKVQSESVQAGSVMKRTIEAMSSIQDSSHEIAEIVTLIDGIAFQTNLLALNAAVEAARAGEHGRGFAVVAGEVRALAQKSADAAKDIKQLIESSVQRIDQGTRLATESGEVIQEITHSIDEVTSMIQQINTASNEQAQGVSLAHKAISDIDSTTQQNANLIEQTSESASNMDNQATQLTANMSFFKTQGVTNTLAIGQSKSIKPTKSS